MTICPFCAPQSGSLVLESPSALALWDGFPIAQGHTLVVPRRHAACLFDLPETDVAALWDLVSKVRAALQTRFRVDAFTIGLNDGRAAGQTVPHAHIHVIPRRPGDVPDPRGGVRWVLPEKADYWSAPYRSAPL